MAYQLLTADTDLINHFKHYLCIIHIFETIQSIRKEAEVLLKQVFSKEQINELAYPLSGFYQFNVFTEKEDLSQQLPLMETYQAKATDYDPIFSKIPRYAYLFHRLGKHCETTYQAYEWAIYFYKKATQFNPTDGENHFRIGYALQCFLMKDGEATYAEEALTAYQKALDYSLSAHSSSRCLNNMGVIYTAYLGLQKQAETCYKKVLKFKPNHISTLNNLADLYIEQQAYGKAKKLLKKAIKQAPHNHTTLANWGEWYMKATTDYETAKTYLKKAIRQQPNSANHYVLLGNLYLDYLNSPKRAKPFYVKALEYEPFNKEAWKRLNEIKENYDV